MAERRLAALPVLGMLALPQKHPVQNTIQPSRAQRAFG